MPNVLFNLQELLMTELRIIGLFFGREGERIETLKGELSYVEVERENMEKSEDFSKGKMVKQRIKG